nr:putative succinate-semialdehyde dehydrogenase [Quercus suber]
MGPVTTERSLDKAAAQVSDAQHFGGQVTLGGKKLQGTSGYADGYFFEPTIITGATKEMLIAREETFAPIMALFEFETEDEAVGRANDTSMGLASCKSSFPLLPLLPICPSIPLLTVETPPPPRFLHQKRRPHLASAREPRGRHDRDEHGQLVGGGVTLWRHQGERLRQRVRQGRRHRRVHDHKDRHVDVERSLLITRRTTLVRKTSVQSADCAQAADGLMSARAKFCGEEH